MLQQDGVLRHYPFRSWNSRHRRSVTAGNRDHQSAFSTAATRAGGVDAEICTRPPLAISITTAALDIAGRPGASLTSASANPGPARSAVGREAGAVLDRLEAVSLFAAEGTEITRTFRTLLPRWPGTLHREANPDDVVDCLQLHRDLAGLETAKTVRKTLTGAVGRGDTQVHNDAKVIIANIGAVDIGKIELTASITRYAARLAHLNGLALQWATMQQLTAKITASDAPIWARQLSTMPAGAVDGLAPINGPLTCNASGLWNGQVGASGDALHRALCAGGRQS